MYNNGYLIHNNYGDIMNNKIVQEVIKENKPRISYFKRMMAAFLVGGSIGMIGEILFQLYFKTFDFDKETSLSLMSITLIVVASIMTGLGIYDKLGQIAGAGTILPITGFSNSMTSAALEYKSEGIIQGIFANMLKLAGTVIVSGSLAAFIVGLIAYLGELLW